MDRALDPTKERVAAWARGHAAAARLIVTEERERLRRLTPAEALAEYDGLADLLPASGALADPALEALSRTERVRLRRLLDRAARATPP